MPCSQCPALCGARTQIVFPSPAPKGGILAIGEAPGAMEDQTGEGFKGQAGKTLDKLFAEHGISRDAYGRANVCRCRPPENRKPTRSEVAACLPKLAEFILETQPSVLLLVGGTATALFLGPGALSVRIERSRKHPLLDASCVTRP